MNFDKSKITLLLTCYRTPMVLACLGFLVTVAMSMGVVGLFAHQARVVAKDKVSANQNDVVSKVSIEHGGVVEGLVLRNVAF